MRSFFRLLNLLYLATGVLLGAYLLGITLLMEGMRHHTPSLGEYFKTYFIATLPVLFFGFLLFSAYVRRITRRFVVAAVMTGLYSLSWIIAEFRRAIEWKLAGEYEIAFTDALIMLLALFATRYLRETLTPRPSVTPLTAEA
jgi:hypothetical protein